MSTTVLHIFDAEGDPTAFDLVRVPEGFSLQMFDRSVIGTDYISVIISPKDAERIQQFLKPLPPDPRLKEQEHICQITDMCYGITGGTRIDCSCRSYWVVSQPATEAQIRQSIADHLHSAGIKPPEIL